MKFKTQVVVAVWKNVTVEAQDEEEAREKIEALKFDEEEEVHQEFDDLVEAIRPTESSKQLCLL